jgi:hypothetical protein
MVSGVVVRVIPDDLTAGTTDESPIFWRTARLVSREHPEIPDRVQELPFVPAPGHLASWNRYRTG